VALASKAVLRRNLGFSAAISKAYNGWHQCNGGWRNGVSSVMANVQSVASAKWLFSWRVGGWRYILDLPQQRIAAAYQQ
jgi:hypothetical protein